VIGHLQKSHSAVAFRFYRRYLVYLPLYGPSVTFQFLLLATNFPNSTCSWVVSLCIIGFAYRAAEARPQK
jgi:hypothetical protein